MSSQGSSFHQPEYTCARCEEKFDAGTRAPVVGACGHKICKVCMDSKRGTKCNDCKQRKSFAFFQKKELSPEPPPVVTQKEHQYHPAMAVSTGKSGVFDSASFVVQKRQKSSFHQTEYTCARCEEKFDAGTRAPVVGACGHKICQVCMDSKRGTKCNDCKQRKSFAFFQKKELSPEPPPVVTQKDHQSHPAMAVSTRKSGVSDRASFVVKKIQKKTEYKHSCGVCGRTCRTPAELAKHARVHTGEKPFECGVCQTKFNDSSSLSRHARVHTGERPFSCDGCEKSFKHSCDLKNHKRIHTGEKPFECDICTKKFNQVTNLKKHRRIHTGEKPFRCGVCQKQFSDRSSWKVHLRIHTGEKPFECDVCTKKFKQVSNLNEHKRIHTGEKPFQCDVCQKQFSSGSHWKIHLRTHTGEKQFECDVCQKKFSDCSKRRSHYKRRH